MSGEYGIRRATLLVGFSTLQRWTPTNLLLLTLPMGISNAIVKPYNCHDNAGYPVSRSQLRHPHLTLVGAPDLCYKTLLSTYLPIQMQK